MPQKPPRRLKLTKSSIDGLKAPDPSGRQTPHWDGNWNGALHGFGVLCSGVTRTKTFIAQRDLPSGKARRVTVGAVNEITLDEARRRAADMLDDMRRGIDPKRRRAAVTLREVLKDYLAARKDLRPASIKLYRLSVEQHLATWADRPLAEISADMVETRHRDIAAEVAGAGRHSGTTMANVALRTLGILHNFAALRADLPPNPVRRLQRQWFAEAKRSRLVRTEDLPKFYAAVCALPNAVARDYLLVLLYTGMRRGEAAALKWADVDFAGRVITLPAAITKSKSEIKLPLTSFVRDLLVARRALGDAGGFVFPSNSATGHIVDTVRPLTMIVKATGIRISAHDLRRTYTTVAESIDDISPWTIATLTGHSIGSITADYAIQNIARLRGPAQKICDKMLELCGVAPVGGENVAKLMG